ncbi:type IV pilus modification PilV family protein [Desulfobacula sp.]
MRLINYNNKGFTFIEVMIAISVLSIGILAISIMQIKTIKDNSTAFSRSYANDISRTFLEELKRLPFDDPNLTAGSDLNAGMAVGAGSPTPLNADHFDPSTLLTIVNMYQVVGNDIIDNTGTRFQLFWNVDKADNITVGAQTYTPFCTIRLFIYWETPLGRNHLTITTIKHNNIEV